jgi:hypothetical protein
MFGYDSPEVLVNRQAVEFVNPDDLAVVVEREKLPQSWSAGQSGGPLWVRFRRRDRSWVDSDVVGSATV